MVIYYAAGAAGAQAGLVRICPGCRKKQVVSAKLKKSAVKCRRCGTLIPPKSSR